MIFPNFFIQFFLAYKLKLKLNKKTNYSKINNGVSFLGFKVFPNYVLLKNTNKKKIYKTVRKYNKLYHKKIFNEKQAMLSLNSWIGHAQNADTYNLIKDVIKRCDWLYNEQIEFNE